MNKILSEHIKTLDSYMDSPNIINIFKLIHNYLYSNSNISKWEKIGNEMIKILFCKIYDELNNIGKFRGDINEDYDKIGSRIKLLFEEVKCTYKDIFNKDDKIYLDNKSISYIVFRLQDFVLTKMERDVIGEAFQIFWGRSLRGEKGQFFTPKNVIKMCVKITNPKNGEKVIDPACGSGGFLVESLKHSNCNIFGIDKEMDLVRICKTYIAIYGGNWKNIFCADSLNVYNWNEEMKEKIKDESFDIVLTNPPFGAKIYIDDKNILKNYELGHKWIKDKRTGTWKITNIIEKQVPQILFIERCLNLLKPGGRMAIVLPDGIFGNPSYRYVWEFILKHAKILGIISLPPETFLPSTHTKTSILILEKKKDDKEDDYNIFMAIANKVGHDKNGKIIYKMDKNGKYIIDEFGNKIIDDDLPEITKKFLEFINTGDIKEPSHLGFTINISKIKNYIFVPSYYNPDTVKELKNLEKSGKYKLVSIKELIDKKIISIKRGHEVGSKYYGLGNIPFIRTSDIANWEINIDPTKCIPEEIYEKYRKKQDIKENDILLVTDGTFLIGRTAIVTPLDKKIVIQSHIKRIRCLKPDILHPYLLIYLLNTKIVQQQIKEKTFVQATISTIGDRLNEIILPIPKDKKTIDKIIAEVSSIINLKIEARKRLENLIKKGDLNGER